MLHGYLFAFREGSVNTVSRCTLEIRGVAESVKRALISVMNTPMYVWRSICTTPA